MWIVTSWFSFWYGHSCCQDVKPPDKHNKQPSDEQHFWKYKFDSDVRSSKTTMMFAYSVRLTPNVNKVNMINTLIVDIPEVLSHSIIHICKHGVGTVTIDWLSPTLMYNLLFLCCCFTSWQHLRSYQDGYRLVTVHIMWLSGISGHGAGCLVF